MLSIKAFATSCGLIWGGCMLCMLVAHGIVPSYGTAFLDAMSSVYPGLHPSPFGLNVLIGTVYGLVDGSIGGAVFAWLYNLTARASAASV